MLCENKLTNLVFKNQENSAKHNLVPFSPFFLIFFYLKKNKQKQPRMKCMNAMQCKSKKQENTKPKNKWSQRVE